MVKSENFTDVCMEMGKQVSYKRLQKFLKLENCIFLKLSLFKKSCKMIVNFTGLFENACFDSEEL